MTGHPMRHAPLHVFQRIDGHEGGAQFVAMFAPYKNYPVTFYGATEGAATGAAEEMRREAIEKHEAAVIVRQAAKAKAAAKRAAKESK